MKGEGNDFPEGLSLRSLLSLSVTQSLRFSSVNWEMTLPLPSRVHVRISIDDGMQVLGTWWGLPENRWFLLTRAYQKFILKVPIIKIIHKSNLIYFSKSTVQPGVNSSQSVWRWKTSTNKSNFYWIRTTCQCFRFSWIMFITTLHRKYYYSS